MTYTITDTNGNWIGGRVYSAANYAIAVAKRSAKARAKNAMTIADEVVYVWEHNDDSLYSRRVATVTTSEVIHHRF